MANPQAIEDYHDMVRRRIHVIETRDKANFVNVADLDPVDRHTAEAVNASLQFAESATRDKLSAKGKVF